MIHNKLFLILMPAVSILATAITLSTFTIPIFGQSAEEGANQTMQDAGQTGQDVQQGASDAASSAGQSANQTGEGMQEGASDVGSKITEGAKDLAGSIGDKLQDLAK
jgi:hypothetical protein